MLGIEKTKGTSKEGREQLTSIVLFKKNAWEYMT